MRVTHRTVAPQIRRLLRAEVHGPGQLPAAGPVILAANHVSNLDNYIMSGASPRPLWFLGKSQLAKGVFGRFMTTMGMVPIERGKGDWGAIETAVRILEAGEVLALFPEGTRSPDGRLYKFRSGMARIAALSGAPVLPVGVRGTRQAWTPGERPALRPPARGLVQVRYGTPLPAPEDTPRARRELTLQVHDAVAALSAQECVNGYAPVAKSGEAASLL